MDLDSYLRIIQDKRMKAAREQRVPLSDRAVQIPKVMAGHKSNHSDLIFLAVSQGRPTSDMAITMLYRRLELDFTTPGSAQHSEIVVPNKPVIPGKSLRQRWPTKLAIRLKRLTPNLVCSTGGDS